MPHLDLNNNLIKRPTALIYKIENGIRFFLLTQELDGNYTIPGGCKDVEDQDLLSAMKREIKEELNLDETDYKIQRTPIQKIYKNLYNIFSERVGKDTIIDLFIALYKNTGNIKSSSEIISFQWFEEGEVYGTLSTPHYREIFLLGIKLLE